jgi:hypothetical protein
MHSSAFPSFSDLGGLIAYLVNNPYLFISSTTVMTSGLLICAVVVSVTPRSSGVLSAIAPTLALILAYFGLGSFALSSEILVRFHASIPYETEVQFVSGVGHLAEAAVGLAVLFPHLRDHSLRDWLSAHNAALAYWTFQIAVLTPPWFSFQGQGALATTGGLVVFLLAACVNVVLWTRAGPRTRD